MNLRLLDLIESVLGFVVLRAAWIVPLAAFLFIVSWCGMAAYITL